MDLIVTTPKKETLNAKKEGKFVGKDKNAYWFRMFHYKPKIEENEKIYFIQNGFIVGYGLVIWNIDLNANEDYVPGMGAKCEVTGRLWKGRYQVAYNRWKWLKRKIEMKGFMGIRYVKNIPGLEVLLYAAKKYK